VSAFAPGFANELLTEEQVVNCTHSIAASSIRRSGRPNGVAGAAIMLTKLGYLTRGVILVDGGMDLR
jgi:NAD(P)-dependent dehydrogenase (short-subunit alcohol dehydrogenase family)